MSRFDGDGRKNLEPCCPEDVPEGSQPMKVRRGMCRHLIEMFDRQGGLSAHGPNGYTVWVILEHCRVNGIRCRVAHNQFGWVIERLP